MDAALYGDGIAQRRQATDRTGDRHSDHRPTPASMAASIARRQRMRCGGPATYDANAAAFTVDRHASQLDHHPPDAQPLIMTKQSRGKDYADLIIMSPEHYAAYDAATVAIQRHHQRTSMGKLGFSFAGVCWRRQARRDRDGRRHRIQHAGQHHVRFDTDSLRLRYHLETGISTTLFEGDGMMPIDKDAVAQFIGWMGELTMVNPFFNWRFYDSVPQLHKLFSLL